MVPFITKLNHATVSAMSRKFRASPGRGSSRVLSRFAPTRASRAAARTRTSEAHSCRVPLLAHRTMTNYELAPPIYSLYSVNAGTASYCSFPRLCAIPSPSFLLLFLSFALLALVFPSSFHFFCFTRSYPEEPKRRAR